MLSNEEVKSFFSTRGAEFTGLSIKTVHYKSVLSQEALAHIFRVSII
jgi:hypothetical protein